jgi:hypothetical protein
MLAKAHGLNPPQYVSLDGRLVLEIRWAPGA